MAASSDSALTSENKSSSTSSTNYNNKEPVTVTEVDWSRKLRFDGNVHYRVRRIGSRLCNPIWSKKQEKYMLGESELDTFKEPEDELVWNAVKHLTLIFDNTDVNLVENNKLGPEPERKKEKKKSNMQLYKETVRRNYSARTLSRTYLIINIIFFNIYSIGKELFQI